MCVCVRERERGREREREGEREYCFRERCEGEIEFYAPLIREKKEGKFATFFLFVLFVHTKYFVSKKYRASKLQKKKKENQTCLTLDAFGLNVKRMQFRFLPI